MSGCYWIIFTVRYKSLEDSSVLSGLLGPTRKRTRQRDFSLRESFIATVVSSTDSSAFVRKTSNSPFIAVQARRLGHERLSPPVACHISSTVFPWQTAPAAASLTYLRLLHRVFRVSLRFSVCYNLIVERKSASKGGRILAPCQQKSCKLTQADQSPEESFPTSQSSFVRHTHACFTEFSLPSHRLTERASTGRAALQNNNDI